MQSNTIDIRLIEALVDQVFPCTIPSRVERVEEGVSTYVYRIDRGNELFYLRVLPEVNASFAPEVYVHNLLRAKDVKVPEVVYFEHCNAALQRSVMVTSAIKGKHLGHYAVNEVSRSTLVEAGRDPFYDLGHFQVHDGETLPARVLPYLLQGYREVVQLPPDYEQRIHFSSLLIALRTLARSMKKRSVDFRRHAGFWSIKRDIEVLQHGGK